MLKIKIVSSLEKALLKDNIDGFSPLNKISVLRGERLSVQLLHTYIFEKDSEHWDPRKTWAALTFSGELAENAYPRDVVNVAVERPALHVSGDDEDYISKEPGVFPDILRPLQYKNKVCVSAGLLFSVWVEISIPEDFAAKTTSLTLKLDDGKGQTASASLEIEVIDAVMPKESIYLTQWFHTDSLAQYYNVPVWSERHWEIIENFARVAHKNGINLLLTPIFTPPLDTEVGGERLTTQLIGVSLEGGRYSFDFTLLDRWVEMCDRIGIEYLEIAHLFTQWGAYHAPKIMATVDGEYKKIFGWETAATGDEYRTFLRTFLPEFISHMKKNGNDGRCFYHISDEPTAEHLESYKAARDVVIDILDGYTVMDALSNYDFWKLGLLTTPIPSNDHIAPFIENNVPNLWTYYCCSQQYKVSNRFIQMPSKRNRSIGFQMYKYDIVGFLHWGYNFYNNCHSADAINPFMQQDGNDWVPPGDSFSVYPAQNGEALESLRIIVFHEALQDLKVMKMCEEHYGKAAVVALIEECIGKDVTFKTCADSAEAILTMRERLNMLLKAATSK